MSFNPDQKKTDEVINKEIEKQDGKTSTSEKGEKKDFFEKIPQKISQLKNNPFWGGYSIGKSVTKRVGGFVGKLFGVEGEVCEKEGGSSNGGDSDPSGGK